jgi:hypothetical protein
MRRIAIGLLVLFAFLGMAESGRAQTNSSGCVTFAGDLAAAQEWFEANGGSATNDFDSMDANGNGVACDEPGAFEGGGPSAGASKCVTFAGDQVAAQEWFEANGGSASNDYQRMDTNHNGIACDEPGAYQDGGPSAGPEGGPSAGPESCADFNTQPEAQTYFENSGGTTGDDPLNLDADGNGIACDEGDVTTGGDNTLSTDGPDESAAVVSALPSTGSGPATGFQFQNATLAAAVTLLLICTSILLRRTGTPRA